MKKFLVDVTFILILVIHIPVVGLMAVSSRFNSWFMSTEYRKWWDRQAGALERWSET